MQSGTLFRQEVLEPDRPWIGGVRLVVPIATRLWLTAASALIAVVVLWLTLGHYTRREHVAGEVVPSAGLLQITARAPATVDRVLVLEGERVKAGQVLATVSAERGSTTLPAASADISEQLRRQQARLREDITNTTALAEQQASDLRMQVTMLSGQVAQVTEQITTQQHLVASLTQLLDRLQPLGGRGFVSAIEIQQQQTQKLEAEAQVRALGRQRLEAEQQLHSAQDQLVQLPLVTAGKLSEPKRQIAQIQQSLDQNEVDRESALRAPADGVVSTIAVKPGQSLSSGEVVVALVPAGATMQAQLLVPSSAAGFVRVGTPVTLHYLAFPYQKFGAHRGHVVRVSASALTPAQLATLQGTTAPTQPMYRVDVALDAQTVQAYGHAERLRPGMAAEADLLLDRRRLIEWVLEPLYGMGRR